MREITGQNPNPARKGNEKRVKKGQQQPKEKDGAQPPTL